MRFLALGILLVFPLADIWLTTRFAEYSRIPLWAWLTMGALIGVMVLRRERMPFRNRTLASMHGQFLLLRQLLDSGRKVLAGILFLAPGLLSDSIALVLLALPINVGPRLRPQPAGFAGGRAAHGARPHEGRYRRLH